MTEAFFAALDCERGAVLVTWGGECKDLAVLRRSAGEFGLAPEKSMFSVAFGLDKAGLDRLVAETVGFEPTKELPLYTLSRRAPSTTRPRLRMRAPSERPQDARPSLSGVAWQADGAPLFDVICVPKSEGWIFEAS
jgi:hypothetical protein